MQLVSVPFTFTQRFPVAAAKVFAWATDYQPDDIALLGKHGRRKAVRVCNDTLTLTDTYVARDGSRTVKRKLVRLYPNRLSWTNTHLTGPNRHSQFLYEIEADGPTRCRLTFSGAQVMALPTGSEREIATAAKKLRDEDSASWKNIARAMAKDLRT